MKAQHLFLLIYLLWWWGDWGPPFLLCQLYEICQVVSLRFVGDYGQFQAQWMTLPFEFLKGFSLTVRFFAIMLFVCGVCYMAGAGCNLQRPLILEQILHGEQFFQLHYTLLLIDSLRESLTDIQGDWKALVLLSLVSFQSLVLSTFWKVPHLPFYKPLLLSKTNNNIFSLLIDLTVC